MTSGATTAGSVLPTEAKVCCTNIAPRAINMGDNRGSARCAADGQAGGENTAPAEQANGFRQVRRQKLGLDANGVSCNSCVQHDLSWVCRYQYASAILTGLMTRSRRFAFRGSLR